MGAGVVAGVLGTVLLIAILATVYHMGIVRGKKKKDDDLR